MSSIANLASGTLKYNEVLKELSVSVYKYFGVTDIGYVNVEDGNKIINIHTNAAWIGHYMQNEYYRLDPHIANPDLMDTGFAIGANYTQDDYIHGLYKDASFKFGMYYGISYVEKSKRGYQAYCFTTTSKNIAMQTKIMNSQAVIKKFVNYMTDRLQPILLSMEDTRVNVELLKGERFFTQEGIVNGTKYNTATLEFLFDIGLVDATTKQNLSDIRLSEQEIRCVRYYLIGKTAEETAKDLQLSRRTVEGYMENIKNKLGCKFKKDLCNKQELLVLLGVL
jgi:DNA-binding CsgD family transcriptional regulator